MIIHDTNRSDTLLHENQEYHSLGGPGTIGDGVYNLPESVASFYLRFPSFHLGHPEHGTPIKLHIPPSEFHDAPSSPLAAPEGRMTDVPTRTGRNAGESKAVREAREAREAEAARIQAEIEAAGGLENVFKSANDEMPDYNAMTVAELTTLASELGVGIPKGAKKNDYVESLQAAFVASTEDGDEEVE
jgi:hypothetical protein